MLVFEEGEKPEYPEKNLSEQRREPTTSSTHIWRRRRDLNPCHIGGRRALTPLRHPLLYQNCVKVITFSMAAYYLLLVSSYSWCLRDLRVQCLELYTACILSQYRWDKAFHFPGKFHFLVKTITDSIRLGVVYWNLVLSTETGLCFVKFIYSLRPTSPRSTIYLLSYKFIKFCSVRLFFFSTTEVINCSKEINILKR